MVLPEGTTHCPTFSRWLDRASVSLQYTLRSRARCATVKEGEDGRILPICPLLYASAQSAIREEAVNVLIDRMIRAARLDPAVYEEVEADKTAMKQAISVVVFSSIAEGVGNAGRGGVGWFAVTAVAALLGWYVWSFLTYIIGAKILPEPQTKADYGELLRTIGFASSPGIIRALGLIPGLHRIVSLITALWMLAAMVIAVRQALDYSNTLKAVWVCVVGWLIQLTVSVLVIFFFFGAAAKTF